MYAAGELVQWPILFLASSSAVLHRFAGVPCCTALTATDDTRVMNGLRTSAVGVAAGTVVHRAPAIAEAHD